MSNIELENIGAIKRLVITTPESGGVVVLRGRNGSGKSTALQAIQAAMTGDGSLEVRDGEKRGEVKAFGATLTVQKNTRRSGAVEVATLEGPGDVSMLVDPGIKDEQAADVRRIRALLALIGAKCDASAFHELLGGAESFASVVSDRSISGDDPVQMADRIKRDIEAAARVEEQAQEKLSTKAAELRRQNDGIDLTFESDADRLSEAWQTATAELADKRAKATAYSAAVIARDAASAKLERLKKEAPDVKAMDELRREAGKKLDDSRKKLEDLEEQIKVAKSQIRIAETEFESASLRARDAERAAAMLVDAQQAVEAGLPERITDDDVAWATAQQAAAQANMERGVKTREAMAREMEARVACSRAAQRMAKGCAYRKAAQGVDGVLSAMVGKACSLLRVESGRLVLTTGRGTTYFGELSHGERWKIALDVAIEAVGVRGVLVCPQEAWEGLDPVNRTEIANHLHGSGVVMFAAEAGDESEIMASEYGSAQ